jgi:hypothetical protein
MVSLNVSILSGRGFGKPRQSPEQLGVVGVWRETSQARDEWVATNLIHPTR